MFVEASVPGRANLFGNPLDIYGGIVLSSSITPRAKASVQSSSRLLLSLGDRECAIRGAADLTSRGDPFDFLRALLRSLAVVPQCHIRATTEIPIRSGLAGSAALMLAASAAVLEFIGRPASQQEILQTAHRAEVDYLGNFCGWNDFYACILGGTHEMNYRVPTDGAPKVKPLTIPDEGVSFAAALTGDMHRSGAVNRTLWDRWRNGDHVVRSEYERLAGLGPSARKAFKAADWPAFGQLMQENFMCQLRLGAANAIEDSMVQHATSLGAFGAKLSGAGHCGSIVVLARDGDHSRIRDGLETLGVEQYFKVVPTEGLVVRRN